MFLSWNAADRGVYYGTYLVFCPRTRPLSTNRHGRGGKRGDEKEEKEEADENEEKEKASCRCPCCLDGDEWSARYPRHRWYHAYCYSHPSQVGKMQDNYIHKPNGISFSDTIRVGQLEHTFTWKFLSRAALFVLVLFSNT